MSAAVSDATHREVLPEEDGLRLDRWLRSRFPRLSFGRLQKLLRTGQIRVDGRRATPGTRLAPGQRVRIPPPLLAEEEGRRRMPPSGRDVRFLRRRIVYADEDVIVLDKPAGLAVQGGPKTPRHLDAMLDALAEGGERPRLVHRLDRDTAGLLLLARNRRAARELMHAFRRHRVRKLYWAVVLGAPRGLEGSIDLPLGKAGPRGEERMTPEAPGARKAVTRYRVLARAGKVGAWLALEPLTGRTHQLRAHCAAMGWPILGDVKYGGERAKPPQAPGGLMLQAVEIEFPHPRTGRAVRVRAQPAAHLRAGLAWLGFAAGDPVPGKWLEDSASERTGGGGHRG